MVGLGSNHQDTVWSISLGVQVASIVRSYYLCEIPLPDLANWSAFLEVILST